MLRRTWRITRSILRCPLTPVVLAVALFIDSYAITAATEPYHHSTVGGWLRNPYGIARRTSCRFDDSWAFVVRNDDGNTELLIEPNDPIDFGHQIAQFEYTTSTSSNGLFAATRAHRSSHLRVTNLAIGDSEELQRYIDGYVDDIIANQATPLQNRGALDMLRSSTTAFSTPPSFDRRSVGETDILWTGVLHNTLAGAALLALLISLPWSLCTIPGRIRRWRWKRDGACIHCGYDITGVPDATTCPECGSATGDH